MKLKSRYSKEQQVEVLEGQEAMTEDGMAELRTPEAEQA